MTLTDIAGHRLNSQQIAGSKFQSPKQLVHWMGAMQAQDYAMAKWAIGVRLPGSTQGLTDAAIDKGDIIRTHVLRPTWHFISADHIYWMLELTAPRIKSASKSRDRDLELTEQIYNKSNSVIENALTVRSDLTREELIAEFARANIATDNNRSSHLLLRAELEGIICSGVSRHNKHTYALLTERVQKVNTFHKEEALAKLALIYFSSHCPATLLDFIWWSGLSVADARHALEIIKPHFVSETIGSQTFWIPNSYSGPVKNGRSAVYLLPAYDEFIISYTDRSAVLNIENHKKTISINGLFRPVVVINGQVAGLWKRTIKNDKLIIDLDLFQPQNNTSRKLIKKASEAFGDFLERKTEVNFLFEEPENR